VDFITVVTGLPRSGTSLMMQMLAAGGIPPLTDNVRRPDESNPRGYFEFEQVKRLRSDQSWIEQARGHAVKIVHLLIRELPIDSRLHYRVILMRRDMREILASQRVMLERQGKKSADETLLAQVYQAQLGELERWLRQREQFATLAVDYADLIRNPRIAAATIDKFLSGDLNIDEMTKAVDPTLYRQRESCFT
jgi:Sulfotransferase domain